MVQPAILGPIDLIEPVIEIVILALVLANLVTRFIAHRIQVKQATEGPAAVSRYRLHETTNILLVLSSFYYLTVHHHSGIILSMFVLSTIIADFFEFEARKVEARQEWSLEVPKAAITGSLFVLAYALYIAFFFGLTPGDVL